MTRVCILGPVAVRDGDRELPLAGSRVRRLLVRLAVDAPHPVSPGELIDAVWYDDDPPAHVANALQSLVSRLRRALPGAGSVQQTPAGYQLVGCDIDVEEFERLAAEGRGLLARGDEVMAGSVLRQALDLWSGSPLADAGDASYALGRGARLSERRMEALCDRIDADLAAGRAVELVPELEDLTRAMPLRERLVGQQMLALARAGRSADALAAYERLRTALADTLGTDPSAPVQEVHLRILRAEEGPAAGGIGAPAGLPLSLTTFVGREDEVKRVHELLSTGRLVTIVGPGGAGKTRLAMEAARSWPTPPAWAGDWLVELASVTDPDDVVPAFLGAMDIREARLTDGPADRPVSREPLPRLLDALSDRRCLLVVDNCEHLVEATAHLLAKILARCPHVRVLATSREPLGIDGEALCAVPPLAMPPADASPQEAMTFPAVRLFADRAGAVRADFAVDSSTVAGVVAIVRRLDGMPLAIELAAARLRVLPVGEVAARLDNRFRLLAGGSRTAVPRHRTLRAVVEWSWDLLTPAERLLAERLAVFPSGASAPTVQAVCAGAGLEPRDVGPALDSLVDKSLLQIAESGSLRYRMLETIRAYGIERLTERGELERVRRTHAAHFAELVADAATRLRGRDQLSGFRTIEREHDNVLAALRCLGEAGEAPRAMTLALDLSWYWMLRNEHADAATWLGFACDLPGAREVDLYPLACTAMVLNRLAGVDDVLVDDADELEQLVAAAGQLRQAPSLGPRFEPHRMLVQMGCAMFADDESELADLLAEGLASDDPWTRAAMRAFRAAIAENRGDLVSMRAEVDRALREFRPLGDRWGLATTLTSQAYLLTLDGDLERAGAAYEEAACLMEDLGAGADSGYLRLRVAGLRVRRGDLDGAWREARSVVEEAGAAGPMGIFATALLASVAAERGDLPAMRRLRDEVVARLDDVDATHAVNGHVTAISLALVGLLSCRDGDPAEAVRFVSRAYPLSVSTHDQPVIAIVGVAVATVAELDGSADVAAEMVGAAARLRGGEDPTDPAIRRLLDRLRTSAGAGFDAAYERGWGLSRDDAIARLDPATLPRRSGEED